MHNIHNIYIYIYIYCVHLYTYIIIYILYMHIVQTCAQTSVSSSRCLVKVTDGVRGEDAGRAVDHRLEDVSSVGLGGNGCFSGVCLPTLSILQQVSCHFDQQASLS